MSFTLILCGGSFIIAMVTRRMSMSAVLRDVLGENTCALPGTAHHSYT